MSNIVPFSLYRAAQRMDGFANALTGFGTSRDHGRQFRWVWDLQLDKNTLDALYEQHELAWKIVDLYPDDALRQWIDTNHKRGPEILRALKQAGIRQALREALGMARLHGGAGVFLDIDDGRDPSEPVDIKRVKGIRSAEVIESCYLHPMELKRSLQHEYWVLCPYEGGPQMVIHRDRLLIVYGTRASRDTILRNGGWPKGVIQRCYQPLLAYSISHDIVPNILKDFIRDVVRMAGLNDLALSQDPADERAFKDRLDAMALAQSMINKLVLDKDDEFVRQVTSVAGINDLIRNPERRLVAASGIPHTKLLGESPGNSLSQSGNSQEKDWHSAVEAYQEDEVRPHLERVILYAAAGEGVYDDVDFTFCPLAIPSAKEQAEVYKLLAEADQIYSGLGVKKSTILKARFGGPQIGLHLQLSEEDLADIEEMEELELEIPDEPEAPEDPPDDVPDGDGA